MSTPLPKESSSPAEPIVRSSPSATRQRALAGGLLLLIVAGYATTVWLHARGCSQFLPFSSTIKILPFLSGLAFAALGALIILYRPENRLAWIALWIAVGFIDFETYVLCGLAGHLQLPAVPYIAWLHYTFGDFMTIVPLFILLPLLYPTGRFLTPRWRQAALGGLALLFMIRLGMGVLPDLRRDNTYGAAYDLDNPFGVSTLAEWWYPFFRNASLFVVCALCFVAIASLVVRLRRAEGDERQQMKWLAYFLVTAVSAQLLIFEIPGGLFYPQIFETIWYELMIAIVLIGFPLTIGVAIFKYRLYDIDILINRTLVYGSLTAMLAFVYFGSIIVLQGFITVLTGHGSDLAIVISTLVIAVLFNPLRLRLQSWIDRRFYRRRYDAELTLQAFARTTRNEANLERITAAVAQVVEETVQPASVSIWLQVRSSGKKEKV